LYFDKFADIKSLRTATSYPGGGYILGLNQAVYTCSSYLRQKTWLQRKLLLALLVWLPKIRSYITM